MTADTELMWRGFLPETEGLIRVICGNGAGSGSYCRKGAGPRGNGNVDNVLKGIDWILKNREHFQVRIVNISVGTQPDLAQEQKQVFLEAVEELWDRGLLLLCRQEITAREKGRLQFRETAAKLSR